MLDWKLRPVKMVVEHDFVLCKEFILKDMMILSQFKHRWTFMVDKQKRELYNS